MPVILRLLAAAPWRRAPLLLLRRPALLASVVAVGVAVGLAATAGPLFLSSVGSAMVAEDLAEGCPATVGLRVIGGGLLSATAPPGVVPANREEALEEAVVGIGMGDGVQLTAVGPVVEAVGAEGTARVRVVHRESIVDKVEPVEVGDVDGGVWLPETAAGLTGIGAGDELVLRPPGRPEVTVPVAGIYRDISLPLTDAWCAHGRLTHPAGFLETPQSLLLTDRQTFADLERSLGPAHSTLVWEAAVPVDGLDLPTASALAADLDVLAEELRTESTELHFAVGAGQASTRLGDFVEVWESTAASVRSGVLPVAAAVVAVCLLFVASVARSWCEHRHAELALLVARGAPPGGLGVKAALETAPGLLVGAAVGTAVAVAGVRLLGPSSLLDRDGARLAAAFVAAALVASVAVTAGVVVSRARRLEDPAAARPRRLGGALLAELVVAAAAAAAWWRITSGDDDLLRQPTGAPRVDALHVLFPLLAIGAVAALVVRVLVRLLPRLRRISATVALPVYLATRRLATGGSSLHVLAVAATVAAGLFACSAVVVSSIGTTLDAKAARFVGSDTAVRVAEVVEDLPPALAGRATAVGRWLRAEDQDGQDVQVIGVDRDTFLDGAFWHGSLSDVSIDEILDELGDTSSDVVPVALAGGRGRAPSAVTFGSGGRAVEVPVEVVALIDAFPGQRGKDPLLVADLARFAERREPSMGEVWGHVGARPMVRALQEAGVTVWGDVSADEVLGIGSFRTTAWTFGFLRAVASMIGVLTIAGLLAHLAGRERRARLGYAIARRFGLRSATSSAASVLELAPVVLVAAAVGGATGLITAAGVHGKLDALARLAPAPLLSVPLATLGLALAVAAVALLIGCVAVQRTADRADVTEVLRAEG